jgi:uncharacterized membrane protein
MKILFAIIGIYIGAVLDQWTGAIFGLVIGILSGTLIQYNKRISDLEERIRQIRSGSIGTGPAQDTRTEMDTVSPPIPDAEQVAETDVTTLIPPEGVADLASIAAAADITPGPVESITAPPSAWTGTRPPADQALAQALENRVIKFIREFFTTGNVVVKVGVIVLFFGFGFLLKFAAERNLFPIELRLAAVAAFGIAMFVLGWRLRHRNLNYALVIQGGAVGILYLTVFSAAKYYLVVPLPLAFFLMLALVLFSSSLAVIQNAMALAIFATVGGFLAPILTSTGEGSHVALFSYYTFLNAGIFGIAWYKSWRPLNWTGFVFTFVIAALWGYRYYQPEYFSTTEPFLVLFFVFYVAIAILFAYRQPPHLKGFVDSSIVFGTPLVGFTLQSGLIREIEFGQAYSALVMSSVYIALARALWNRKVEGMRMLTEAFVALGVIFASLAIPLALDGRWTAAAWAVEGGGMMWIGIRQNRLLPRLFGLLLQFGAGIAFLSVMHDPHGDLPVLNSAYLGAVMVSIAGLFTGYHCFRHNDKLKEQERWLHVALLGWGLLWWFGAGLMEIDHHLSGLLENNAELFFFAFSMYYLYILARALHWLPALKPQILLLPLMACMAFINFVDFHSTNPFSRYGFVSWITAFGVQYLLLYRSEHVWNKRLVGWWHRGTLWLVYFVLTWICAQAVSKHVPGLQNWGHIMWGLIPAIGILALINVRKRIEWPLRHFTPDYLGIGLLPVTVYLAIWIVIVSFYEGSPKPLPYIPVMNPHELAQLFAMVAIIDWLIRWKRNEVPPVMNLNPEYLLVVLAGVAFLWLNTVVARSVHFYGNVSYALAPMGHSALFQASISITWALTALGLMGMASRSGTRKLWFTGAVLLGMVVVKLFMVDLADIGTVARIVSFLTVGVLMLVIGYISPLPPRADNAALENSA